jgi:hypothetical protein
MCLDLNVVKPEMYEWLTNSNSDYYLLSKKVQLSFRRTVIFYNL